MSEMQQREVSVLLVEDDEIDAEAVIRSFRASKIANPITVASDGVEALRILRGENGRNPLKRPYVVLLDLNMPRMNGLEFLAALREDPALSDSVIFVLTTSSAEDDRIQSYSQHVAGYMVKSEVGPSFKNAIELIDHYWTTVVLPE